MLKNVSFDELKQAMQFVAYSSSKELLKNVSVYAV